MEKPRQSLDAPLDQTSLHSCLVVVSPQLGLRGLMENLGVSHLSLPLFPSLHARCIYNSSDLLPLGVEVAAPPTVASVVMPGPLGLQLRIATGGCSLSRSLSHFPSHSTPSQHSHR